MSRIGRMPIAIPAGVTVEIAENNKVTVKGPKGTLERVLPAEMDIKQEGSEIVVSRPNDLKKMKSLHGLTRTLIHNMIIGVTEGYEKKLEVNGVGYRAQKQGKKLVLSLGYSHPVEMEDPEGIETVLDGTNIIIVAALSMLYVFVLAYVVRLWMRPYKNPQAKKLRAYGRRSAVIEQLNTELRDKLYFHYHGIYVTDNFLVATYWFHTDVIRLDDVRYLSKNRVEERSGRELYRLTLSEPETDLFYEIDFREEELIDACVDAIRG